MRHPWLIIAAVHLWALWALAPTVLGPDTPSWLLAPSALNLSAELQGGLLMRLDLHPEEAISEDLRREAASLSDRFDGIQRNAERTGLLILASDAEARAHVAQWSPHYQERGRVTIGRLDYIELIPTDAWRDRRGELAMARAEANIRERLEACSLSGRHTFTREGAHIWLDLPSAEDGACM